MTLLLLLEPLHAEDPQVSEAISSIRSLISPFLPGPKAKPTGSADEFRFDKCQIEKLNWSEIFTLQKAATLDFTFQVGCDIQGSIAPKILVPFPFDLKLRNLKTYERVEGMNKVTSTFDMKPVVSIEMREGLLHGKSGKVKFEADYKVILDPMNRQKWIEKNLGGEIRINEIDGKKVSIKEKIFVQMRRK